MLVDHCAGVLETLSVYSFQSLRERERVSQRESPLVPHTFILPFGRVCNELCETSRAVSDVSSPISGGSSFSLFSLNISVVKLYKQQTTIHLLHFHTHTHTHTDTHTQS